MDIKGATALVTGGGSGLGAATARRLATFGARVAVVDRDGQAAKAVAQEIGGAAFTADVSDQKQIEAVFDDAARAFTGAPRIVVHCAGIGTAARILPRDGALPLAQFEQTIRVNLIGTYIVLGVAARAMTGLAPLGPDGERGVIVTTASVAYEDGQIGQAAYAASKGGVASMVLPAAREFARFGVRVAAIAPGIFETPMGVALPEETKKGLVANIPFPARLGRPEEYARLAQAIIENPMLNGTVIRLDGGARMPPK